MIPDQKPISDSDLVWVERDAKSGLGIAGWMVLAIIARLRAREAELALLNGAIDDMARRNAGRE